MELKTEKEINNYIEAYNKLRAGIDINTLLEIAVFKGLGAGIDINTFNKYRLGNNKYMKVFREEFKVA